MEGQTNGHAFRQMYTNMTINFGQVWSRDKMRDSLLENGDNIGSESAMW